MLVSNEGNPNAFLNKNTENVIFGVTEKKGFLNLKLLFEALALLIEYIT